MTTATPSTAAFTSGRSGIPIPWGAPRDRRIGGYVISHKTAQKWAARLLGLQELDVLDALCAEVLVNRRIKKYRAKLTLVGEDPNDPFCMIVTHFAWFKGRVGMPASEIPQFIPNEADAMARKFLIEQGVDESEFAFETWLD